MANTDVRPGVLFYFEDVLPVVEQMKPAEFGILMRDLILYAAHGEAPPPRKAKIEMAFAIIRQRVDRDGESYEQKSVAGRYASYCRMEKAAGREPLKISEWRKSSTVDNDR